MSQNAMILCWHTSSELGLTAMRYSNGCGIWESAFEADETQAVAAISYIIEDWEELSLKAAGDSERITCVLKFRARYHDDLQRFCAARPAYPDHAVPHVHSHF